MKKLIKFLKSHLGAHAIEAIVVAPIWMVCILLCIHFYNLSAIRQSLSDETTAIVAIVKSSKSELEAKTNVDNYVTDTNLTKKFVKTENGISDYLTISKVNENDDWVKGTMIYINLTINTHYSGSDFLTFQLGEETYYFLTKSFSNRILVVLDPRR